jgi:large-conductance mechanosensitive channel
MQTDTWSFAGGLDLITPFIAAIVGKPDFSAIEFTINGSKFPIGDFINAVISFILIAALLSISDDERSTGAG